MMGDHPSHAQLLDIVYRFLKEDFRSSSVDESQRVWEAQTAAELVKMVERSIALSISQAYAEWERLNGIQGTDIAPPDMTKIEEALSRRNEAFAEGIRQGKYDDAHGRAALLAHFLVTAQAALEITNPRYLYSRLHEID